MVIHTGSERGQIDSHVLQRVERRYSQEHIRRWTGVSLETFAAGAARDEAHAATVQAAHPRRRSFDHNRTHQVVRLCLDCDLVLARYPSAESRTSHGLCSQCLDQRIREVRKGTSDA